MALPLPLNSWAPLYRIFVLQVAIRALGFEVKKADVLKILKDYDKEGKGKITFQDFNEISKSIID